MDVLIIGGGAAGLMAARELSRAGQTVCILEARNRIGGRIFTLPDSSCGIACEGGAEFIHGKLHETLELLKEAGLQYEKAGGELYTFSGSEWKKELEMVENTPLIMERLENLKENISITEFLSKEFPGEEYKGLRQSLTSYVEGYYSGDANRTSALAFYSEWQTEDDDQFRPRDGYGKLIQYLKVECEKAGTLIQLSTVVKEIRWGKDQVEVLDETHHQYTARKVIIAIPLGVWLAPNGEKGAISFTPSLTNKAEAAKKMGFGYAIKILLQFKSVFWQDKDRVAHSQEGSEFGFVFCNTPISTWWSQKPNTVPLLTGWVSGPKAKEFADLEDQAIMEKAVCSVAEIFELTVEEVRQNLQSWHIFNWVKDPFTRGSYTYSTIETKQARAVMMEPVENTLFFAGEALYDGPEMGTVEAALISGKRAAKEVLG